MCKRLLAVMLSVSAVLQVSAVNVFPWGNGVADLPNVKHLKLYQDFPANVILRRNPDNGTVQYLKMPPSQEGRSPIIRPAGSPEDVALGFITQYKRQFRLQNPGEELQCLSVAGDELGMIHIRFQQIYSGISIWGGEMNVHLGKDNTVYLVQGRYIPTPVTISIQPLLNSSQALDILSHEASLPRDSLNPKKLELVIYQNVNTSALLTYTIGLPGWVYFIDAASGRVVDRIATRYTEGINLAPK